MASLIFVIGVLVSGFATTIGFGGGIFMIPILVIGFHFPIHYAIGAVVVSLLPAGLIATTANFKQRLVDPMAGIWLEVPTAIGAALGAFITAYISVKHLEILFSVFVLYIGFKMFSPPGKKGNSLVARLNAVGPKLHRQKLGVAYEIGAAAAVVFGMMAGLIAGMFGIGGGFLKTPIMIQVFRMPVKVAVATALFMIVFTSLSASISHYMLGHVVLRLAGPVFASFIVGAFIGNRLRGRFSDVHTRQLIAAGLVLAGAATLFYAAMIQ